jgi:mRNA interferase MazF
VIEPWQVWLADLDPVEGHEQGGVRPVVIISSVSHLRSQQGRSVLVTPVTSRDKRVRNHIPILNPKGDTNFVMTEQIRYVSTSRFLRSEPWWTLNDPEIIQVRRMLRVMVDF